MTRAVTFWLFFILSILATGRAIAAEVIISQTDGDSRLGGSLPLGQSFFATKTGLLKSIDVVGTGSFVARLRVYSGNGTGGNVLHEQTFTVPQTHTSGSSYTFTTLVLDDDVPITQNQRYTFVFDSAESGSVGLFAKDGNPFSGGEFINNNGFTADMTFRVVQADDLPAVTLSVGNTTIDEDGGTATITATLDETFTDDVTVNLGFSGTATSGSDYATPSTTITIPAGDTSANASTGITASADTIHEGNETIIIDITGATNAEEDGTQQKTITITDDDSAPIVTLSTGSATIGEDGGNSTITATLSNPSSSAVTVDLSYSGTASSGTDYSTPSSSITVPAGQTTANATTGITATGDVIYEGNETVIIDISSVTNGSENGTQQQTITIDDAESPPTVSLSTSTSSIAEAAGSSTLTATLSTAAAETVTVNLAYSGTATNGTDYATGPASISVSAGQTTGTATITATQDGTVEDDEIIIVDISSVSGGSASEDSTQQRTITITDDDNTVPTLTSFASAIDSTDEDTAVEITFAELAAQGDEADAEGDVAAFVVKAVSSGTLTINGSALATGTNDQITTSKSANWTPASNANGTLSAFTVVALDGDDAESTPAVTAQISVAAVNDAPTLTAFDSAVDSTNEDTAVAISFADLRARGDEEDAEGAVSGFVVKSVTTGSLTIDGSAFATGTNDQITSSKAASWTPAENANGTLNAFTVVALDGDAVESASAITAQVSVSAVNDLPTFTAFDAVIDSTNEDTAVEITLADLTAQGNETDVEGAMPAFVVKTVTSGTLTINGSAFATSSNDQITASKSANWTPASNANGTLDAFTVVALDSDGAQTDTPVTAQISVAAVNDIPTLTAFADVVDSTDEDTAIEISSADLAAQGDESDTEGTVSAWEVKAVSSGSLTIGGSAFAAGTNSRIDAGSTASWTPANNANGTLNAFTVVAVDESGAESSSAITAQINVTAVNDAPTLTSFSSEIDSTNEDTAVEITFAELASKGDESDTEGTVDAFVVKQVTNGSLTINGSAFAASTNDQITAGKSANWTPAANDNGTIRAFTVVALDDDDSQSTSAVSATVSVAAINDRPSIATNSGLITYTGSKSAISKQALNEGDPDDDGAGLIYTVTSTPTLGQLELNTNAGTAINSFTQADIDNNRLQYFNSSFKDGEDSFKFRLEDGGENQSTAVSGVFNISVQNPEIPPFPEQETAISNTRPNDEILNNPIITDSGVLIGGSVSGTTQNDGILRDVIVTEDATVVGGTLQGTTNSRGTVNDVTVADGATLDGGTVGGVINNSGEIRNVTLDRDTNVVGGLLTGQIVGKADSPALLQSTIGAGAFVDNVVIGRNSVIDSTAMLGSNVTFDSTSSVPPGMRLTPVFSSIPWAAEPDHVQTVNLQDTMFSQLGDGKGMSLLESIEQLDQISIGNISTSQNTTSGEFILNGQDFTSTLLPVAVDQADFNAEPGLHYTEDGDINFVTATQQQIMVYPALNNETAMRAGLGDLTLEFDDRANLVIGSPDDETSYVARPELIATPAPENATSGLQFAARTVPANTASVALVYENESGKLMQQSIVPIPSDWMALKSTLNNTQGVENLHIGSDGIIQLTVNGMPVAAMAEYNVTKSSASESLPNAVQITDAGDINGDGIGDFVMTYPNGDVQGLYILP